MSPVISKKASSQSANISIPIPDDAEAVWELGSEEIAGGSAGAWAKPEGELAIDVYVTPSAVVVRSAMAGVRPQDISISLHNDLLTIRGARQEEEIIEADRFVLQECHWGSFSRSVILPVTVEGRGAEAVMKNGILKVILPRMNPSLVSLRVDDLSYE